jgi:hypothetical protein
VTNTTGAHHAQDQVEHLVAMQPDHLAERPLVTLSQAGDQQALGEAHRGGKRPGTGTRSPKGSLHVIMDSGAR